jgi:thiamine-phosphate pyrophosphorylase
VTLVADRLPMLMLVADVERLREPGDLRRLTAALDDGVNAVQVRGRGSTPDAECVVRAASSAVAGRALLLVNARIIGATGNLSAVPCVHVPEGADVPVGDYAIVSRAVHSANAAEEAERAGADMLILGTVFPSATHAGGATMGLQGVRDVCEAVRVPVIGIGGITRDNAAAVIDAGASGVAVISAIYDADDPGAAARELRGAIDAAWERRAR